MADKRRRRKIGNMSGAQPHYHPQPGPQDGRGNCPACADYSPERYGWKEAMTPSEAIRRVEQKLVSARTIAASEHAFEKYAKDMLPDMKEVSACNEHALIHQGFDAGYSAAMDAVRAILIPIQSEVLRDGK